MAIYKIIDAKPAPSTNRGVIFWLKSNLFPDIKNSAQPLVGLYLLYLIVPPFLNWPLFDATWSATQDEIVNGGARWIFIREKFDLFMYGFHPEALHWRPNSVILLTIAFVLSVRYLSNIKEKIVIILLYPFLFFVLINGGWFSLEIVPTEKWGA